MHSALLQLLRDALQLRLLESQLVAHLSNLCQTVSLPLPQATCRCFPAKLGGSLPGPCLGQRHFVRRKRNLDFTILEQIGHRQCGQLPKAPHDMIVWGSSANQATGLDLHQCGHRQSVSKEAQNHGRHTGCTEWEAWVWKRVKEAHRANIVSVENVANWSWIRFRQTARVAEVVDRHVVCEVQVLDLMLLMGCSAWLRSRLAAMIKLLQQLRQESARPKPPHARHSQQHTTKPKKLSTLLSSSDPHTLHSIWRVLKIYLAFLFYYFIFWHSMSCSVLFLFGWHIFSQPIWQSYITFLFDIFWLAFYLALSTRAQLLPELAKRLNFQVCQRSR